MGLLTDRRRYMNPNGYEFIDIGSSVLWCTCNIGAENPWDYGWYFMWGDTTAYKSDRTPVGGGEAISFDWSNYPLCNGSEDTMIKYCTNPDYGIVDNKTTLEPEDDAAHVHIGGGARMPTSEDFTELEYYCRKTWVTNYNDTGVEGMLYTRYSDSSKKLFFPVTGELDGAEYNYFKESGKIWWNRVNLSGYGLDQSQSFKGMYWFFYLYDDYYPENYSVPKERYIGMPIRAVLPK